ncbi:ATP-binding domain-containing protein [Cupriavidus sp. DF5525]|uniref:ATP-binding domain-containing protein n=1 Tax=Cupriavidus sp. DF5525 TaxID=3160989 RepID=UPI0032E0459C
MAKIVPDGWEVVQDAGPQQRELETLGVLAECLSDDYAVYHSVHWTNIERSHAIYGEIDFVIVNRAAQILVIEQKSGFLSETEDGLVKNYANKAKVVSVQMGRTVDSLRSKLARALNDQFVAIEYLLYCPDYVVRNPLTAGLSPERIVDAKRRDQLGALIQKFLPPGEDDPTAERVHRFLRDMIHLEVDVSALVGRAKTMVTRVAGGLAHWARQLEMEPFRLRVTGTAGSGKTQLALAEYTDAIRQGKRPLYVCFNRPLADHFGRIAPAGGLACTFHMLCDQMLRHAGSIPDFTQADAFTRLVCDVASLAIPQEFQFDTVIVDEGQDFAPDWRDLVLRHARPGSRVIWLEDPIQNLYGHPPADLPGWIRLHAKSNFRSPRPVVRFLQSLLENGTDIEARAPISTWEVDFLTYQDPADMRETVKDGIKRCYADGFRKSEVVLLSYRGRESSGLLCFNQLGPHSLRTFTGEYDDAGQPLFSEGDVLAESVYRFKGQSAPAVILAEIDFEMLDERELRKLFVGATRATMKLVLVLSDRAAGALLERMEGAG